MKDDRRTVTGKGVRELREQHRPVRNRHAAFRGVKAVVQPDADDLPGATDRWQERASILGRRERRRPMKPRRMCLDGAHGTRTTAEEVADVTGIEVVGTPAADSRSFTSYRRPSSRRQPVRSRRSRRFIIEPPRGTPRFPVRARPEDPDRAGDPFVEREMGRPADQPSQAAVVDLGGEGQLIGL